MAHRRNAVIFVALLATAVAAVLHAIALKHGGALWRDEVNGVNVANLPTLADLYDKLPFESFPMLWPLVLRGWIGLFGDADPALRMLGALIGVGGVAAVWVAARQMNATAPVVSLGMFCMHPDVLRFGDSLRAYGLGAALLVLAVAAIWRLAHDHSRRNVIVAAVMVFLCAHSVYYNALFLLAAAVAMTIVCARRRQWKPVAILAVIGVVTALSGYPYLATLREMSAFNALLRYPEFGFAQLLGAVRQTLDAPFNAMSVLWLALAGGAVCVALWCVVRRRPHSDVAVYAAITLVLGVGGYAAFLLYARYPAWTTYFIVPMALAALCIDVSFAAALRGRAQWVQAVAMCVLVALGGSAAWRAAHLRMTNIDAVASVLNRDASDSDLVVVMHWTTGLSFQRYYDGAAPWMTLPPLEDHSVHRFDQLKTRMASETAINPVLLAMERTMKDGGTIYLVRHEPPWPSNRAPVFLPAAPHPVTDWLALPYVVAWKSQVDFFVAQFADRAAQAPLPDVGPVQPHERMWLAVVRGWREKPVR